MLSLVEIGTCCELKITVVMRSTFSTRGTKPLTSSYRIGDHIFVSIVWFALFSQWATVIPTIVPDQVRLILGSSGTNAKELMSGIIMAIS
jgi:hypothetical protein